MASPNDHGNQPATTATTATAAVVVRIRMRRGQVVQGCDVYIGRQMTMGGWNLARSMWANPFAMSATVDRAEACRLYEDWIKSQPHLMARLSELQGKKLGCWCKPKPCHGDVLARLAAESAEHAEA